MRAARKRAPHAPRRGRGRADLGRVRIRRGTLRDLDLLVRHRRRMWEDIWRSETPAKRVMDEADRAYRRWVVERFRQRRLIAFVAETGGQRRRLALGSGCLWLRSERQPFPGARGPPYRTPYLLSMYTEPEARGHRIATRIVSEAIRWSRRGGYGTLLLHASEMGRGVYSRLGFRRSREMVLRLRPTGGSPRQARNARSRPRGRGSG